MTNRDFDQDDAEVLAEFAGLNESGSHYWNDNRELYKQSWKPWSLKAPMWQIKSLLDAVRDKRLEEEFDFELSHMIYEGGDQLTAIDYASAPPEAICSAILSMEVE